MGKTEMRLNDLLQEYGSMRKLALHLGISRDILRGRFKKENLPIPTQSVSIRRIRSNHIVISNSALELIDGIVIGDGHISSVTNGYSGSLILGSSFVEFAQAIGESLGAVGIPSYQIKSFRKADGHFSYYQRTYTYIELGLLWTRWYNEKKKTIPKDLSNTSTMWRWFYVGDGSLGRSGTWTHYITICVCCFTEKECQFLCLLLAQHGIAAHIKDSIENKRHVLYIGTKDVEKFLAFIGPSPWSFFDYKWNLSERPTRSCKLCKEKFIPRRSDMIFCSRPCGVRYSHPFYQAMLGHVHRAA